AQLYSLNRLRDLPERLRSPDSSKVGFGSTGDLAKAASDVNVKAAADRTRISEEVPPSPSPPNKGEVRRVEETPPSPSPPEKSEVRRVSEGTLMGNAIRMVGPVYPPGAKMVNAWGEVQVLVVISETGKVVEARAVSGHLLLRKAAVNAAREWVF